MRKYIDYIILIITAPLWIIPILILGVKMAYDDAKKKEPINEYKVKLEKNREEQIQSKAFVDLLGKVYNKN